MDRFIGQHAVSVDYSTSYEYILSVAVSVFSMICRAPSASESEAEGFSAASSALAYNADAIRTKRE